MEIIMNAKMIMQNNCTFKYNVKILQTIKNVIILYKQQKQDLIDQIKTQGFAMYQQIIIQPNEFQHLQTLLDNPHTSELYCKIIQLLKLKRYVNYCKLPVKLGLRFIPVKMGLLAFQTTFSDSRHFIGSKLSQLI
ncbi:Hypothetical_protein [Hexamita inflata]|uniref:Hypothetical_protein n=1 Tax=Hexamita inflata TaxID=28002 RepID=A0AA86P6D9_9EUKA|nr:Hypothetical protein HINF_LOCUS18712 [Hexamita inflata]